MSINPKIYSKCLSADENRSFSYLVTNENSVLACGVTTKGKIITLERLGAAYCLKLYDLTTNSQKWERIIQKDMKVLQYSNINIFVINDEKHAFELVDRDESIKLYEKIRGCIKKLTSSTSSNPTNQSRTESPVTRLKPVRPPPTYKIQNNRPLKSNVLTTTTVNIVDDLIDISETISNQTNDDNNATSTSNTNLVKENRKPLPRIRYPEESNRNALPSSSVITNSNNHPNNSSPLLSDRRPSKTNLDNTSISSPLLNTRRIETQSSTAQGRTLSIHLHPTIENTRIPIPSPRRNRPPNLDSSTTRSPIFGESVITQDVGIPISPGRVPTIAASLNQIHTSGVTVLSRQNSIENSVENPVNNNGSLNSTSNQRSGNLFAASPMLNRRVPNLVTPSTNINQNNVNIGSNAAFNMGVITSDYEPASTSNVIASVINGRFGNGQTSAFSGSTSTTNPNSSVASTVTSVSSNLQNHQLTNCIATASSSSNILNSIIYTESHNEMAQLNGDTNVSYSLPSSVSSPNLSNNLENLNRIMVPSNGINCFPTNSGTVPSFGPTPIQLPKRRVKTANSANRYKTKSAFIQPTSVVTDIFVQVKSRFFSKEEMKPPTKCIEIGRPTEVKHQIHLDSLDFRNMQLNDTQLKGLIKSKSVENISSLDTNLKVFELDEEGPTCVICLTDPPTHVIVPCGHKILCEACVQQNVLSRLRRKWCMTCNGVIREIIKVYE